METLQSCPCCLSDVEIICVSRPNNIKQNYYFFIHCNHCGKGTANAYPSKMILATIWNSMVLENKHSYLE